jgi:hypothetical protein
MARSALALWMLRAQRALCNNQGANMNVKMQTKMQQKQRESRKCKERLQRPHNKGKQ